MKKNYINNLPSSILSVSHLKNLKFNVTDWVSLLNQFQPPSLHWKPFILLFINHKILTHLYLFNHEFPFLCLTRILLHPLFLIFSKNFLTFLMTHFFTSLDHNKIFSSTHLSKLIAFTITDKLNQRL